MSGRLWRVWNRRWNGCIIEEEQSGKWRDDIPGLMRIKVECKFKKPICAIYDGDCLELQVDNAQTCPLCIVWLGLRSD